MFKSFFARADAEEETMVGVMHSVKSGSWSQRCLLNPNDLLACAGGIPSTSSPNQEELKARHA